MHIPKKHQPSPTKQPAGATSNQLTAPPKCTIMHSTKLNSKECALFWQKTTPLKYIQI